MDPFSETRDKSNTAPESSDQANQAMPLQIHDYSGNIAFYCITCTVRSLNITVCSECEDKKPSTLFQQDSVKPNVS